MEQLSDINKRIRSVSEIRQMTKAMQLISAVKMRKAREQLEMAYPFFAFCAETFALLRYHAERDEWNFLHKRKKKEGARWRQAYFVFSGDQGMAGSYIVNLLQTVESTIHQNTIEKTKMGYLTEAKVFLLGSVGKDRLTRNGFQIEESFQAPISPPTYQRSMDISEYIYSLYDSGEYDEIYFIYTQMFSAMNMKAQAIRVLPAEVHTLENVYSHSKLFNVFKQRTEEEKAQINFVPDMTEVFHYLVNTYLNGIVYGTLTEAFASEHTARMTAMDNATKNADDMIVSLTIKGNQARQSKVTNELSEIVGGAAALESIEANRKLKEEEET